MTIYCPVCDSSFPEKHPSAGNTVYCPRCGSIGYGTYDMNGEPIIEWYCTGDGGLRGRK